MLTDASAEETARHYYVYYEPCAYIAIALNPIAQEAVLYSDYIAWGSKDAVFRGIQDGAAQRLTQGRIAEALQFTIDLSVLLHRGATR